MKFDDLLHSISDRVRTMKAQGISAKKEDSAKMAPLEGNEAANPKGNDRNDMWKRKVESPPKPSTGKKQKTIKCFVCNASHPLERCNKLLNMELEQRTEILKKDGRCYRCLEKPTPYHIAKFCNSEGFKCADCGYNHPTILCGLRQLMQKKRQEQEAAQAQGGNQRQPKPKGTNPATKTSNDAASGGMSTGGANGGGNNGTGSTEGGPGPATHNLNSI